LRENFIHSDSGDYHRVEMRSCRLRGMAVGLLLATACGRIDFDPVDVPASGQRLRLTYTAAPGGARSQYGAYDLELGTRCSVRTFEDGTLRCLPDSQSVAYRDPGCTQPVAYNANANVAGCTNEPFAVATEPLSNSRRRYQVYEMGPPTPVNASYSRGLGGTCTLNNALPVDTTYYEVGPEIPLEELATLVVTTAGGVGRLQQRFYASADGFRMPAELYDRDLDVACRASGTRLGVACVPVDEVSNAVYATSSSCTDRVVATYDDAIPRFAFDQGQYVCSEYPDATYLAVGAEIATPSELRAPGAGTCPVTTAPPGGSFHATAGEVALAPLTEIPFSSGGARIQLAQ